MILWRITSFVGAPNIKSELDDGTAQRGYPTSGISTGSKKAEHEQQQARAFPIGPNLYPTASSLGALSTRAKVSPSMKNRAVARIKKPSTKCHFAAGQSLCLTQEEADLPNKIMCVSIGGRQ
jgi:hypothetical protein